MSEQTRFALDEDQRVAFAAVIHACLGQGVSRAERRAVPRAVLHSLALHAELAADQVRQSPYVAKTFEPVHAWMLHDETSRAGYDSPESAFDGILSHTPMLQRLSMRTHFAALTLFSRFLARVADAKAPLHSECDAVWASMQQHHRQAHGSPVPSAATSPSNVQRHAMGGNAAPSGAREKTYSVFLVLRECLVMASSVLEVDLHDADICVVHPRTTEEVACTRLITNVVGFGPTIVTPLDIIDKVLYSAVPRCPLRSFDGVVTLQEIAYNEMRHWRHNPDFGLAPAASMGAFILTNVMSHLTKDSGDAETRNLLEELRKDCIAAARQARAAAASEAAPRSATAAPTTVVHPTAPAVQA